MRKSFKAKSSEDGTYLLNLACGTRTHRVWNNMDFSPYARMAHHRALARFLRIIRVLSIPRHQRLLEIDPEIIMWDLCRGIPFEDETFDAVYSSHFIEHLEREAVPKLLTECFRVLKHDATIRIVIPDLLSLVNQYSKSVELLEGGVLSAAEDHEKAIVALFDQMVRVDATGTSKGNWFLRRIEHLFRGDARKQGVMHRWMYDKYSLTSLLTSVGFKKVKVVTALESGIKGWTNFQLDCDENGNVYKPVSLYVEGVKQ